MESEPSRFCIKCGYALVVATNNQCPECGQRFLPDQPITFTSKPAPPKIKRFAISFACSFAISLLLVLFLLLLPESIVDDYDELIMITLLGIICLGVTAAAFWIRYFFSLLGAAFGSYWGFLNTLNAVISIQQKSLSNTDWPLFLAFLVILPVASLLISSPVWLIKRRVMNNRRQRLLQGTE